MSTNNNLPATVEQQVTAVEVIDETGVDPQVLTARRFPRDPVLAKAKIEAIATMDAETAGEMFYRVPRSGKAIEGPSARLAEAVASSWGNLRVKVLKASPPSPTDKTVSATAVAWDMETNTAYEVSVSRSIMGKKGRYGDDMVNTTTNAAASIAMRNAVLKAVPSIIWRNALVQAKVASLGKGPIEEKAIAGVEHFEKLGAERHQIFKIVAVSKMEEIGVDEVLTLRGLANAIREGDTTLDQILGRKKKTGLEGGQ